jgi:hypothetical protein
MIWDLTCAQPQQLMQARLAPTSVDIMNNIVELQKGAGKAGADNAIMLWYSGVARPFSTADVSLVGLGFHENHWKDDGLGAERLVSLLP